MSTAAERVARGVALLDDRVPGWDTRIDLHQLDLDSACLCVLGQVRGDAYSMSPYMAMARDLGLDHHDDRVSHGFCADDGDEDDLWMADMAALDAEWRKVITAWREATS